MKVAEQRRLVASAAKNLWDRRPNETIKAWTAFQLFRDMGAGRTVKAVGVEIGKSDRKLYVNWVRKYDWILRAEAFDAHLEGVKLFAFEQEARLMGMRQARLGVRLQEVGGNRLEEFATRHELRETLTAQDTIRLIKEGVEVERTARGETKREAGGNIIFNLFTGAMPRWAPKNLPVVIEGGGGGEGEEKAEGGEPNV